VDSSSIFTGAERALLFYAGDPTGSESVKPWRQGNVVRAHVGRRVRRADGERGERARRTVCRAPVVALDERPDVRRGATRRERPMTPGHVARVDYEYVP
jgi:hypothetical protein